MAALLLLFIPLRILSPVVTLAYPLYESYKCITLSPSALRQASALPPAPGDGVGGSGGAAIPAPSWTSRLSAYGYQWASGPASSAHPGAAVDGVAGAGARPRSSTSGGRSSLGGTTNVLDAALPSAGEVAELESWLMYWSILALIHLVESTVEWVWNWIPLYAHLKILFEFWLVLPQTRGATYLYITYVEPFLNEHENDIDDLVAEAKRKAHAASMAWIARLWAAIRDTIVPSIATASAQAQGSSGKNQSTAARAAQDEDEDDADGDVDAATGPTYRPYWPGLRGVNTNHLFEAAMSALNSQGAAVAATRSAHEDD